jgi:hypothetical protein
MKAFAAGLLLMAVASFAQTGSSGSSLHAEAGATPKISAVQTVIPLTSSSTLNVPSEMGGAFMVPAKCDEDSNLYIRKYATDRPMLGPVVKIDQDGKRAALFDPTAFSKLDLDRADAFSPASDGGLYQIAQKGILKPRIYVLRFSSDGSPSSPVLLDADLEVYTFAAFPGGNFLVSGVQRDARNSKDRGRNFTAVFSADGRELAQLSLEDAQVGGKAGTKEGVSRPSQKSLAEKPAPTLDLSDAEVGADGNLYVMRSSSPALVYVIAPTGEIRRTLKVASPAPGLTPSAFHVSGNQVAVSFWNDEKQTQILVVMDAETGRKIAIFSGATGAGASFACYSASDGVFTFLKLGEGNALEVIRAEAR